jgi:hypothetical protein
MAFTPAQRRRLWNNSPEHHADATSMAGFERIVTLTERAHGIGGKVARAKGVNMNQHKDALFDNVIWHTESPPTEGWYIIQAASPNMWRGWFSGEVWVHGINMGDAAGAPLQFEPTHRLIWRCRLSNEPRE